MQPCAVVSPASTSFAYTWSDRTAPRLRPLQLLLPVLCTVSASAAVSRLRPLQLAASQLCLLQLPVAASRLRSLQLLLLECVRTRLLSRTRVCLLSRTRSTKYTLLNSDPDQSATNSFFANLTDSISSSDLLSSDISSTLVLNALEQLKKGKSDGSSLYFLMFLYIYAKDILSNYPFESTFHCCCKTWLCSQALKRLYSSADS